jgi:chemotaxis protein methyltransferase CheR
VAYGQLPKDLSLAEFRQFRDYIHQHSGIFMEESKRDSLRLSLVTRATRVGAESWDLYFEALSHDEAEFKELMSLVTINETSFFRFPAQFETLRSSVLPEIIGERTGDNRTIRFWSAGCSTGEEPYSIAMTWADSGFDAMGWQAQIVGTDVSAKALSAAKAGLYPARSLLNVPDDVVRRHFVKAEASFRVGPHVRSLVDLEYHNLIKEPYPLAFTGNFDVIFCRNVTIYFRLESTRRVVANLYRALNEGGYLFIGHSETLGSINDHFELVELGGIFLYRKPRASIRASRPAPKTSRQAPPAVARTVPGSGAGAPSTGARGDRARGKSSETGSDAHRRTERAARRPRAVATPEVHAPAPAPTPAQEGLTAARDLLSAGSAKEALEAVDAMLAASPHDAEAHLFAAQLTADAGDYERALVECQKALAINPLLPGARYVLGLIHHREGDLIRAISELKKTVYIDPDFALAHLTLGNLYKGEGRFAEACRAYENALRALYKAPEGGWTQYLGGWKADVVLRTCERSLLECRKAIGTA